MTISEYLQLERRDMDIADSVFDMTITACYDESIFAEEITDPFTLFNAQFLSKVNLASGGDYPVADFYQFIENNFDLFKDFTKNHWIRDYPDKDDFIEQWILELDQYMAGNVSESFYQTICDELTSKCEPCLGPSKEIGDDRL